MTLSDNPDEYAGLPVLFDLEEIDAGTRLTISQDRADFGDEQVAATIAGYNAFVDDIERELVRMQKRLIGARFAALVNPAVRFRADLTACDDGMPRPTHPERNLA